MADQQPVAATPEEKKGEEKKTGGGEKKAHIVVKDPRVDTALHIIKGAIVQVLNTPLTLAVQFQSITKGRITVEYSPKEKPTAEQLQKIEDLTNEKIKENLQPQHFTLPRSEAEERFKDGVNGTQIYDNFKVPASVTELTIVLWEGWNVNCCRGPHSPSGDLGYLKIERVNHRDRKKELEFCFALLDASAAVTGKKGVEVVSKAPPTSGPAKKGKNSASPSTTTSSTTTTKPLKADHVPDVSSKILEKTFEQFLKTFEDEPVVLERLQGKRNEISLNLEASIQVHLNALKNISYSNGFQAGKTQH